MPNTREKLIELLSQVQYQGNAVHGYQDKYILNSELADHLIANGVTIPVRCKNCHRCGVYTSGKLYCKHQDGLTDPKPDDFCSYGERRNDG